jgi:hypothetical protein
VWSSSDGDEVTLGGGVDNIRLIKDSIAVARLIEVEEDKVGDPITEMPDGDGSLVGVGWRPRTEVSDDEKCHAAAEASGFSGSCINKRMIPSPEVTRGSVAVAYTCVHSPHRSLL